MKTKIIYAVLLVGAFSGNQLYAQKQVIKDLQVTGGTPATGKVLTSDGTGNASWQTPSTTVVNATPNAGVTVSGSGAPATPYSIGLTNGTTVGQVMTWNGTAWVATAPTVATAPWFNVATGTQATDNTQSIYQMGQVLVNTATVPTGGTNAKLIVNSATNGAVQIKDGTEGAGKVLTSDVNGVGTWKNPSVSAYGIYPSGTLTTTAFAATGWGNTGLTFTITKAGLYYLDLRLVGSLTGTGSVSIQANLANSTAGGWGPINPTQAVNANAPSTIDQRASILAWLATGTYYYTYYFLGPGTAFFTPNISTLSNSRLMLIGEGALPAGYINDSGFWKL